MRNIELSNILCYIKNNYNYKVMLKSFKVFEIFYKLT